MTPRALLVALAAVGLAASGALFAHRRALAADLAAIAGARAAADTATADARLAAEVDRIRLALEQARSRPERDAEPHLALTLSDDHLALERGGIVLRAAGVRAALPRGIYAVEAVGADAIALTGGARLVPVADAATTPTSGAVHVPRADFDAIRPNVKAGQRAFVF